MISQREIFFQAEDGIRDSVASRGLGDVYKRQLLKTDILVNCFCLNNLLHPRLDQQLQQDQCHPLCVLHEHAVYLQVPGLQ